MTIAIRPIREDDIPGFHAALDEVAREARYLAMTEAPPIEQTAAFVKGILERGDIQIVAVDGDRVVGWCDILAGQRHTLAHVGTLGMGLAASHRGRGIGDRLIGATIAAAHAKGITRIQLLVITGNDRAQALYRKHGFVPEGTRRHAVLINGTYLDDHMMALVS